MAWDKSLHVNNVVTANGNSANVVVNGNQPDPIEFRLDISNVSGTAPTIDITIQESEDGTNFTDVAKLPQKNSAVVNQKGYFQATKKYVRFNYVVTGTSPSFTVDVRLK